MSDIASEDVWWFSRRISSRGSPYIVTGGAPDRAEPALRGILGEVRWPLSTPPLVYARKCGGSVNRIITLEQPAPLWTAARWVALLATVILIVMFWAAPQASLTILWFVLIPVLPAVFLVNVEVWRNLCPLATLSLLAGKVGRRRAADASWFRVAGWVGILLLAVMVPARRFLFNVDASALGVTVVAVAGLALLGGFLFDMKAGFCNAVCPVLPVEKLYGQRPLVSVGNARCIPCTACTGSCIDLVPDRAALMAVASAKEGPGWTRTPYGLFALAFPGFVVAYYLLPDGTMSDALTVYGTVVGASAVSWLALALTARLVGLEARRGLVLAGALAVGLYYWFAPVGIAERFTLPTTFVWGVRVVTLSLVGLWLVRGLRWDAGRQSAQGVRV